MSETSYQLRPIRESTLQTWVLHVFSLCVPNYNNILNTDNSDINQTEVNLALIYRSTSKIDC